MTEQELDILAQDSSRELIERHIGEDPARAALRLGPHAALLSTQIKYLQRAKTKLPSYHRARCIIPPLAFEQASSEAAAEAKTYEGGLCIDLTCGLGVDSLMLSRRFRRVVSLERDPVLALVARYNFERLEARNIEVICTSAETFVAEFAGTADLIYADPARRDGPAGPAGGVLARRPFADAPPAANSPTDSRQGIPAVRYGRGFRPVRRRGVGRGRVVARRVQGAADRSARHGPAGSTRSIASHGNRPGHPDLSPGAAARRKAGRRIRPSLRIPARPRRLALQNPGGPLLPAIGRRIRRLGNRATGLHDICPTISSDTRIRSKRSCRIVPRH